MAELVSLGELLVDFTPCGKSGNGNPLFERNPGGGPANLACAAARLGADTAFLGKVGDDVFGRALREILQANGVNTDGLRLSGEHPTTLAFVHLAEDGDRSFSFYRHGGADTMLTPEELDRQAIESARVFFFSSVLMAEGPSREASFAAARLAREAGAVVAFDPNLRLNLWDNPEDARECILCAIPYADLLKVSEEELVFLTGESDPEKGARLLSERFRLNVVLTTLGPKGCLACARSPETGETTVLRVGGFPAETVDTTGAGDSFTGGFLSRLLRRGGDATVYARDREAFLADLRYANAVGSLTTTKKGGIPALPSPDEVEAYLATLTDVP
ncbi:MAG TPA: carbohydrate kinase [Firmicutes bacterium]|nr:carbohydrate kinase [Bacillota bacterium]